jgi:hypothetical protein
VSRSAPLAAALVLAAAGSVRAQTTDNSIDLHHVYRPVDGHGFMNVDDAWTLDEPLDLWTGATASHSHNPLEFGRPGDNPTARIVRQITMVDVSASVALVQSISLGVVVPVVLDLDGKDLNLNRDTRGYGVGSMRLQLKATLLALGEPEDDVRFGLGLKPFVKIPTGRSRDYLSDNDSMTGGATTMLTLELWRRVRLGVEVGYEFVSSDIDLLDLEIEDRIRFGVAAEVVVIQPTTEAERSRRKADIAERRARGESTHYDPGHGHGLALGGELFGWTRSARPFHDERERPIEGMGYVRWWHETGVLARGGYGGGVNNGVGAPDYRAIFELGYRF